MNGAFRGDRRDFLKKSAAVLAAAAATPLLGSPGAWAGSVPKGRLGLVGMDHVGLTVPDIAEAVDWFQDVMGASAPLTFGPFATRRQAR